MGEAGWYIFGRGIERGIEWGIGKKGADWFKWSKVKQKHKRPERGNWKFRQGTRRPG